MDEQERRDVEQAETEPQETPEQKTEVNEKQEKKEEKPKKSKKKEELDQLKAQLDEQTDQYKRMLAEYANYKRRTEQEKEAIGQFARADLLKKLLPTIDNFERAAEAPDGPEYRRGVEMTAEQLTEALRSAGLEAFGAVGDAYDPELHHAVMREDAEELDAETVTEVFQKGYRLGDRILRPAMVKVAN